MKKFTKLILIFAVLAFLLVPARSAQAQNPSGDGGKVVFGQSFTLNSGETLGGDLVVFGGSVTIEKGAKVEGSVVVFGGGMDFAESAEITGDMAIIGGSVKVNGIVNGSIVVVGGQVSLADTAVIHGDVAAVGGQIERDPKAQVDGKVIENVAAPSVQIPNLPIAPSAPHVPTIPVVNGNTNPVLQAIGLLLFSFVVAGLSMLLVIFMPGQVDRVGQTIVRQPFISGSFGLLTYILLPFAFVILSITFVLFPVAVLAVFLIGIAWLFGVFGLGQEIGERFTKAINQTWPPVLATGFGTFFLVILIGGFNLLNFIPGTQCFTIILVVLLSLITTGSTIMTWFGSRPGPGVSSQPVQIPPAS